MKLMRISRFVRAAGYRTVTEPVLLVVGNEVLGRYVPAKWEEERQREAMQSDRKPR